MKVCGEIWGGDRRNVWGESLDMYWEDKDEDAGQGWIEGLGDIWGEGWRGKVLEMREDCL